jgi:TonB-dependent starch-binding outer membrane protein SusC
MKKFRKWKDFAFLKHFNKLLLTMRIFLFLSVITCLNISANVYSQNTRIDLQVEDITLRDLLKIIETKSNLRFFFSDDVKNLSKTVSITAQNEPIDDILKKLLSDGTVSYKVLDNNIVVLTPFGSFQKQKISGKVTDATTGEAIIGANIVIQGTTTGTITDVEGNFSLEIPIENATIVISSVGYLNETIPITSQTILEIKLIPDVKNLEDVIVVGYGVQKKSNVTGAIASVKVDDLQNRGADNVGKALQGKVSGVQILNMSSAPGAGPTFRVRGYSSNSSNIDPLYIVDGLKVANIDYLDPNNIGSIEILKDAASAAIYGAEAGNGVVLISTKSGKKGTSRFFYNGSYSSQSQGNKMKMMDATQFKDFWMQGGQPESAFQNGNTDWNSVVFGNGSKQSHTLGFEGGTEKGSFYVSLTYNSDNGMVVGNNDINKRLTAQVNASYDVKPWLKVGTTNSIERGKIINVSSNSMTASGSVIGGGFFYDPTVPVYYNNDADAPAGLGMLTAEAHGLNVLRNNQGQIYGSSLLMQSDLAHPLAMIRNNTNDNWRTNINGTMYTEFKPFKGLIYTSRLGYRFGNTYTTNFDAGHYYNNSQQSARGALTQELINNVYYQWENFTNYLISLGKNNFTAMAGMSYSSNNRSNVRGNTAGLQSDSPNYQYLDFSMASATDNVFGNSIDTRDMSYFGRFGWDYNNTYMLQASYRADAFDASKLSNEKRWGYFPSISGGWVLTNEEFMNNLGFKPLSFLKIRASWGINGNVSVLQNYPYVSSMILGGNSGYYSFNSPLVTAAAPSNIRANNELVWERSKQTDVAIETRFFDNRLTLVVDYYKKNTDGLLYTGSPAPAVSGASTMSKNIGEIENSGFEFELGWKGEIGGFKYEINGNMATLHNEVLSSPYGNGRFGGGGGFLTNATYFEKGQPIWYIRTNVIDHIDATNGQPVYKTAAQLGTDDGMAPQGSGIPDLTYGVTLNTSYKNFDLKVFGIGQEGSKLFLGLVRPDLPLMNLPEFVYNDRWTSTHTDAKRPSASVFQTGFGGVSTYAQSTDWVFDNSFFKVKEIQFGYTFPSKFTNAAKISSLRVFVSLENFFTFTKYPGIDPESMAGTTSGQTVTIPGGPTLSLGGGLSVDRIQYPSMKQVVFGVNLSF